MTMRDLNEAADGRNSQVSAEHADAIRALGKRMVADVIQIGGRLSECKLICGHGNWLAWLEREFGWSADTAERFIQVSTPSNQIPQLAEFDLPLSGLYLLAASSTPEEARNEIIKRAEAGEPVAVSDVKETVGSAKRKSWSRERYQRHMAKKRRRVTTTENPASTEDDPRARPSPGPSRILPVSAGTWAPDSRPERTPRIVCSGGAAGPQSRPATCAS
jgi:Protein of unknown function (DUF3102)